MTSDIKTKLRNGQVNLREALAAERTILADERTFLAYIRTAITSGISGGTLLEFFHKSLIISLFGWVLIAFAFMTLFWGIFRVIKIKRLIPWAE